jgi:hypothetical protein
MAGKVKDAAKKPTKGTIRGTNAKPDKKSVAKESKASAKPNKQVKAAPPALAKVLEAAKNPVKAADAKSDTKAVLKESKTPPPSILVPLEKKLTGAPELLAHAQSLSVVVKNKKLGDVVAKIGLCMDISGSMSRSYSDGTVQMIVNKLFPVAVQFDDNGAMDFWYYGSTCKRMPAVTLSNYQNAVPATWNSLMTQLGGGTDACKAMDAITALYASNSLLGAVTALFKPKLPLPAYVLFITDGEVFDRNGIKERLIKASRYPIFWQFIGAGGRNYGILQELGAIQGRYVDNANFFALDDFRSVSDAELYERLLEKFPRWLTEMQQKGML